MFCRKQVKLEFIIEDDRWDNFPDWLDDISYRVIKQTFATIHQPILRGMEVNVMLTNDKGIQRFNRDYRGFDRPTNVLSFETGDRLLLGDIVMSLDTLMREADEQNITIRDHYAHLLCHGILHLLGFDHIEEDEANEMEFFEIKILEKLKIENPYE